MAHMVPHDTLEHPEALRAPLPEFHRRRAHIAQPILLVCTFFLRLKPVTGSTGNGTGHWDKTAAYNQHNSRTCALSGGTTAFHIVQPSTLEIPLFGGDFWALEMTWRINTL